MHKKVDLYLQIALIIFVIPIQFIMLNEVTILLEYQLGHIFGYVLQVIMVLSGCIFGICLYRGIRYRASFALVLQSMAMIYTAATYFWFLQRLDMIDLLTDRFAWVFYISIPLSYLFSMFLRGKTEIKE